MKKRILIKDYYPDFISSRKSINILKQIDFNAIGRDIIFDFTEIVFISRSFAHEFIEFSKKNNLNVKLENTNTNLNAVFSAVKKTETSSKRIFDNIPITSFKNKLELNSFFATI